MATLTIRNLPDAARDRLRVRAAQNGRSMEAEARAILTQLDTSDAAGPTIFRERVRRVQDGFEPYRADGGSVADELIADRREKVRRDEKEGRRLGREAEEAGRGASFIPRETQADKLARARAIVRQYVPEGRSLVDEFLAERRAMWGED